MHMQPYIIQYPSTYPNCDSSQRPVVTNNNLVKSKFIDSQEGERNKKQDNNCLQPRWCPSGLSHTQKRRRVLALTGPTWASVRRTFAGSTGEPV